jgi:prephenate dehydrogenase
MGLEVKETTAQKHDEIMAYTQAITHFFSRAAATTIPFEDFEFTTPSAKRLQNIIKEVKDDSKELFIDMQTKNPYAIKTRKKFLKELNKINEELWKKK